MDGKCSDVTRGEGNERRFSVLVAGVGANPQQVPQQAGEQATLKRKSDESTTSTAVPLRRKWALYPSSILAWVKGLPRGFPLILMTCSCPASLPKPCRVLDITPTPRRTGICHRTVGRAIITKEHGAVPSDCEKKEARALKLERPVASMHHLTLPEVGRWSMISAGQNAPRPVRSGRRTLLAGTPCQAPTPLRIRRYAHQTR